MRYLSIDVLRGLAILLMIQVHFCENLALRDDATGWLYDASAWLGLLSAPFFTFLAGVSYALWLRKQIAQNVSEDAITRVSVRRGLFLFVLGIAFNVLVWLPEDTFNWDILTLIGSALLLLAFARHLPSPVLIVLCVLILILSPPLRAAADYADYWKDHAYEYDFTLRDVSLGFVVNGYFPLLPWLIFPIAGYLVTDRIFPAGPARFPTALLILGVILLAAGTVAVVAGPSTSGPLGKHYLTGLTMFPATTPYLLVMLGLSIVALIVLHRWLDQNPNVTGAGWSLTFLRRYSAYSLTVYVLHHAAHLWPLWIVSAAYHTDATHYWRQAMSAPLALGLALAFVIACTGLLVWLERGRRASLETFFRWVCE